MPHEPIPDDIRELIQRHIDSVAQLEALLFLRAHQADFWAAALVAKRLYAPEADIVRALARLSTDGFLEHQGDAYRYQGSEDQCGKVDRLAEIYARHLIPVTNLIHAKLRNIREFSDAFKFRRND
jgi:hypothetical protein